MPISSDPTRYAPTPSPAGNLTNRCALMTNRHWSRTKSVCAHETPSCAVWPCRFGASVAITNVVSPDGGCHHFDYAIPLQFAPSQTQMVAISPPHVNASCHVQAVAVTDARSGRSSRLVQAPDWGVSARVNAESGKCQIRQTRVSASQRLSRSGLSAYSPRWPRFPGSDRQSTDRRGPWSSFGARRCAYFSPGSQHAGRLRLLCGAHGCFWTWTLLPYRRMSFVTCGPSGCGSRE